MAFPPAIYTSTGDKIAGRYRHWRKASPSRRSASAPERPQTRGEDPYLIPAIPLFWSTRTTTLRSSA